MNMKINRLSNRICLEVIFWIRNYQIKRRSKEHVSYISHALYPKTAFRHVVGNCSYLLNYIYSPALSPRHNPEMGEGIFFLFPLEQLEHQKDTPSIKHDTTFATMESNYSKQTKLIKLIVLELTNQIELNSLKKQIYSVRLNYNLICTKQYVFSSLIATFNVELEILFELDFNSINQYRLYRIRGTYSIT